MRGEPIAAVNVGLRSMLTALRQDPYAIESVHISVITFDVEAREVLPLTHIEDVSLPEIMVNGSGPTFLGQALLLLIEKVNRDVHRTSADRKGDWRPLLFVMTDGSPSDTAAYREAVSVIKTMVFGLIVGCAAGPKAKHESLLALTDRVVSLDTTDSKTFASFFTWVSASVVSGSVSGGTSSDAPLPPPPSEVNFVL
jgi:uncharacterized protein YegL